MELKHQPKVYKYKYKWLFIIYKVNYDHNIYFHAHKCLVLSISYFIQIVQDLKSCVLFWLYRINCSSVTHETIIQSEPLPVTCLIGLIDYI